MRRMFGRIIVAFAITATASGSIPFAYADPQCPATGCPHGQANNPPPANVNSPSYKDGYKTEHDYFAVPQNHAYLASEMKSGYTAALACQVELGGGSAPANETDWLGGCVDALRDLGFKS
jgi:hypothetical protein